MLTPCMTFEAKDVNLRLAFPILLRHLRRRHPPGGLRRLIGMALRMSGDIKQLGGAELIELMKEEKDEQVLGHLGAALATAARREDLDEIKLLLRANRGSHWGRTMLPAAVARLEGEKSIPFLIELLDDHPAVAYSAAKTLTRKKAKVAAPNLVAWATRLNADEDWGYEAKALLKRVSALGWT